MPLRPGTRLGPYEILSALGAGGMGEVYKAHDNRLNRSVAIKVLPPAFVSDADRLARFEREAKAVAALSHPNILAIFDTGVQDTHAYVVTELLDGETLAERLQSGPLPVRKAIEIAVQIARGLAAAHAKGIVHRDLKPANVFVLADGQVKILDFGLAKSIATDSDTTAAAATDPGSILGTAGYMAPEQVRGQAVDARTDLFAFGTVLYEMLTGQRAFKRDTAAETLTAILNDDPPELTGTRPDLSSALERIIRHCLEKNPAERFQTARDVAFALEAFSGSATSPALTPVATRKGRRWLSTIAGLCGLMLLLGVGYALGHRGVAGERPLPSFHRLTFRRGGAPSARFAPDGRTILYGAAWDGDPVRVFSRRLERPESSRLDLPDAGLEAVSSSGELLIMLNRHLGRLWETLTLARVPIGGGAPRSLADNVLGADWGPDGAIASIRKVGDRYRLEYPEGHLLYESARGLNSPRVSRNGDLVAFWAAEDGGMAVEVVDHTGLKRTLAGGWGGVGRYLVWSPSGEEVWFSAAASKTFMWDYQLRAVSLTGGLRLLLRLPATLYPQDVSPDGKQLILGVGALRQVCRCLPPGESHERDLSWFGSTSVHDLSVDGRLVLLSEAVGSAQGANVAYVRNVDGSPPTKIADLYALALSPDGRWVVGVDEADRHVLVPTGAGEPHPLDMKGFDTVWWYPDSKHLLLSADVPSANTHCVAVDIETSSRTPVTPDGVTCPLPPSPDGKQLLLKDGKGRWLLYPSSHEPMRQVPNLTASDVPLQWAEDSRSLYVQRQYFPIAKIDSVDLTTGKRQLAREIALADPAGFNPEVSALFIAPNGSYCYSYLQGLTELYSVEGIR